MLSILVPVYNNARALTDLAARLARVMQDRPYEVVFVNDGSVDDSGAILRDLAHSDARVKVISLSRNFGQHPAISAALEHACGDTFVLMDADLQDQPEDIPRLLEPLATHEIVYSIKRPTAQSAQRITSAIYHYVFSRIVGVRVPANIGTFRAFTLRVRDAMLLFPERNILYGPLMFYVGFPSAFVELEHMARPAGGSSYTFARRLAMAVNSLLSYSDLPHRALVYLGILLVVGSALYGTATIVGYLWLGRALPDGLNLVVLLLVLMLGSLMTSLGIIGAYLFRVYEEVLRRPRYIVAERINVAAPRPVAPQ